MKPSVVAIIKGGLGNQLFSYAAARAFALRNERDLLIDDDSGFTRDGYGRSFRLNRFPIAGVPAPEDLRLGDPKGVRHKFVRSLNKLLPRHSRFYIPERAGMRPESLRDLKSTRPTLYLNGYWQDEGYFIDFADEIRNELEPPALESPADSELETELNSTLSIFIHVRRCSYSPRLTSSYYTNSIQEALSQFPECQFEVFGDDIHWARQNLEFHGRPARFHDAEVFDELRDFRLMTACRHAIVANSSFSWWAAWLGQTENKVVWTPEHPGWPVKSSKQWIKIPNELET